LQRKEETEIWTNETRQDSSDLFEAQNLLKRVEKCGLIKWFLGAIKQGPIWGRSVEFESSIFQTVFYAYSMDVYRS
jgi:hypothetical protein